MARVSHAELPLSRPDLGGAQAAGRGAGLLPEAQRCAEDARLSRARAGRKPQKDLAEAAKLLGDRSTGLAQIEAYREAVRSWNRLVDDPKNADAAADQYDVVLGFARIFDAKKDWPDAQSAYRVAMKIAALNYVKDPSDTSWRDKAEAAERASVVAGRRPRRRPTRGAVGRPPSPSRSCAQRWSPSGIESFGTRPSSQPRTAAAHVTPPPSAPGRGRRECHRYARCRSTAGHNRPSRRSPAAPPA